MKDQPGGASVDAERHDEAASAGGGNPQIRLVIVDDHVLYRRGLELVLNQEPDMHVVGEASDGREALTVVAAAVPDVVLMDVRMPRCTGIEACALIKEKFPQVKVVMLTTSDDEQDLFESIRAGATGYLLKDVPPEEVVDGVRAVCAGQSLISPSMASTLLNEFATMVRHAPQAVVPAPRLTDRELQVLRLVARGMANKEIAQALFISENTVKNHVRNILEKLQLHSRMEAAMYAVRAKLVDAPE